MIKLNGYKVPYTLFPDNTSQVWGIPEKAFESESYEIEWDFFHEMEFIHLAQLKDLIDKRNVYKDVNLYVPYLPFARQDKDVLNDRTFALHTFAKLINGLGFNKITSLDTHSNVAENLITYFENLSPKEHIEFSFKESCSEVIAVPDAGAYTRYGSMVDYSSIIGNKVRNQKTGHIEEYTFEGNPKGKKVLIVDDICDGGMTFRLLSKSLLDAGAKEVNLYVTHGIFSKGLKVLKKDGINRIFTHKGEVFDTKMGPSYKPIPPEGLYESETSNM